MRQTHSRAVVCASVLLITLPLVLSDSPALAEDQKTTGGSRRIQERGVQPQLGLLSSPPPFTYGAESVVRMCAMRATCDQMTQPIPRKRPTQCIGQSARQQPQDSKGGAS
jgi:hypothetical protein